MGDRVPTRIMFMSITWWCGVDCDPGGFERVVPLLDSVLAGGQCGHIRHGSGRDIRYSTSLSQRVGPTSLSAACRAAGRSAKLRQLSMKEPPGVIWRRRVRSRRNAERSSRELRAPSPRLRSLVQGGQRPCGDTQRVQHAMRGRPRDLGEHRIVTASSGTTSNSSA